MLKLSIKAILVTVGFVHAASAGSASPRTPPPVIVSTTVDFKENGMVITGHNFGRTPPIVRLGNQILTVKSFAPSQAVVGLPPGIRPATYRLTVTTDGPYRLTSRPLVRWYPPLLTDNGRRMGSSAEERGASFRLEC